MPAKQGSNVELLQEIKKLHSANDDIKKALDSNSKETKDAINKLSESIQKLSKSVEDQVEETRQMADRLDELERKETTHQQYIRFLEVRIKRLEDDKRKGNLIIDGIQEADNENLSNTVSELLRDLSVNFGVEQIDNVFRTGLKRDNNKRPRPILVKLRSAHLKGEIFKRVKNLRNNMKWRNVYLNDDLSPEEQHKRREMRCIVALAKSRGIRCQLKNGGLVIDDQRYTHSDMERLPYGLSMTEAKIVKVEDGTAFQGHHAFMSNMFQVNIKYEGHTYFSAERLYQTMCVEACNDHELAKEIKRTVDPYGNVLGPSLFFLIPCTYMI